MGSENQGQGISQAEIDAAVANAVSGGLPSKPADEVDKALAEFNEIITGNLEDQDPDAPAPEPEDKPEAEPKGDAAPEPSKGEDKPVAKPEPAEKPVSVALYSPDKTKWDTERQRRDQETANTLKAKDAEIAALRAKLEKPATAPEGQPADELDQLGRDIETLAKNPEATQEDWGKAMKGMVAALKHAKASGQDTSEVRALKERVEQLAAERQAADREAGLTRAQQQLNATLDKLDQEYAPQLRNAAVEIVKARLAERGYGDDRPAPVDLVESYFETAYAQADRKHPELKAGKPKKEAKPAARPPRSDPGTGGGVVQTVKGGRLEDVAGRMLREGKFAPKR